MDHKTFIDKVAAQSRLGKDSCETLLSALTKIAEETLTEGDSVNFPSFGSFELKKRNERIIAHPSSPGKRMLVPPKLIISFKPSSTLKNRINNG